MTLLLDTHVVLWWILAPERLRPSACEAIASPDHDVLVSAVVAWEIALKQSLGKLVIPGPAESWLPAQCRAAGFEQVPITWDEALGVRSLPWHHRDPFDRILIAQTTAGRTLVTHDRMLERYGVPVMHA